MTKHIAVMLAVAMVLSSFSCAFAVEFDGRHLGELEKEVKLHIKDMEEIVKNI